MSKERWGRRTIAETKRNEFVRLGNEMSAKEVQKIRGKMPNRGAKIHATDGERSDLGFYPNESLRTNDSNVLHRTTSSFIDLCWIFRRFQNVDNGNENDLIHCLVRHKYEPKMDPRCRAGIDHHQIVRLRFDASRFCHVDRFSFLDQHERRSVYQR